MTIRIECINLKCENKAVVTDGIQAFCKECLKLDLNIRIKILAEHHKLNKGEFN